MAEAIGLATARFVAALDGVAVDAHIRDTRAAMHRYGLHGFPSFVLERDGILQRLAHERCYGDPPTFLAQVMGFASDGQLALG